MVERLDLSEFVGGAPAAGAPMHLLGDLFSSPGIATLSGGSWNPLDEGAFSDLTQSGVEGMLLPEWSELWNDAGTLQDPFALMRYLNAAQVGSPGAADNFLRPGMKNVPDAYSGIGASGWDPLGYDQFLGSGAYGAGDYTDALTAWLWNQSYRGYDAGKSWGGQDRPGDKNPMFYDPSLLRYTQMPEGWESWGSGDWDQWAQGEGANNLWDLVSRPSETIAMENAWRQDPSLWFNPMAPQGSVGILGEGSGLGALGDIRMGQMNQEMQSFVDRQNQISALGPELFMAHAARNDPGFARSQLGRYHGMAAPGMGQWAQMMSPYAGEAPDLSYLIQSRMQPYMMRDQLQAYLNSLGMSV